MANITKLSNGIKVVSEYMPSVSSVAVGVWAPIGARNETKEESGISHFIEHMAFKGTKSRSAMEIAEEIEAVGGYLNAWTSRDATAWYSRVLKDDVPLAMDIISDILLNPTFDENELEKERTVILQEIAQSQDFPDDVLYDAFQQACYDEQPLGQNILGTTKNVSSFSRDTLKNWLDTQHLQSDFIIAAAGNVDHQKFVEKSEERFASLKSFETHGFSPSRWAANEKRIHRDLEQVQFVLGFEGYAYNHSNYYAASVFSTLFGGGMSSRLFQEIREKEGLVYGIGSFHSSHADGGCFGIQGATTPDNIQKVLKLSAKELNKVVDNLDQKEIARAKNQLKAAVLMSLETVSNRVEQISRQMMIFGVVLDPKDVQERIEAIDKANILDFIEFVHQSPIAFATIGQEKSLPYKDDFVQYLKQ